MQFSVQSVVAGISLHAQLLLEQLYCDNRSEAWSSSDVTVMGQPMALAQQEGLPSLPRNTLQREPLALGLRLMVLKKSKAMDL
jgi:hypothetical protein